MANGKIFYPFTGNVGQDIDLANQMEKIYRAAKTLNQTANTINLENKFGYKDHTMSKSGQRILKNDLSKIENWFDSPEYEQGMNNTWTNKLVGEGVSYNDLGPAGKKLVEIGKAKDDSHNDQEANQIKEEHPELVKKAREGR